MPAVTPPAEPPLQGWRAAALATAFAGALLALLVRLIGPGSALALLVGLGAIVGAAWLPRRSVRWLGPLLLAGLLFAALRPKLGILAAGAPAVLTLLAARRWASLAVLRRVTFIVPSLVLLIFVTTLLMYLAPGNPFASEQVASPQVEEALRASYGVPRDALEFFEIYMRRLLVEGTLGPSIKVQGRSVEALIGPALPVSLALGVLALTFAVALGLVLGICAGLRPNSRADSASMGLALLGISLPNFVIGALLVIVFGLSLRVLPVAGWGSR